MSMKKGMLIAAVLSVIVSGWVGISSALKAPHDKASNNISCSSCHIMGAKLRGFKPVCTLNCHNTTSTNPSRKAVMETEFVANPFGTFTIDDAERKPRSHAYGTLPNYSAAGMNNKRAGTNKYITVNQTNIKVVSGTNTIICSKCHIAHGSDNASLARNPFVRASTKGDYICFQCHEERRVGAGSAHGAPVAGKAYSHPVEVNYSTIRADKPTYFETAPTNTYGLPSAVLPLYTTYDNVKGAVVCSTCHGPLHSADSNPYTMDNMSAFSYGVFSTLNNNGKLLRRYPPSVSNNMCLACHKVSTHQGKKCSDCHEPHKRQGENNIYLIKQTIATPWGNHSVFFTSTTQMAKRFRIYSGSVGNFKVRSTAVCQVCHSAKNHHRAYSTTGADRTHNMYSTASGWKSKNCTKCHPHNASSGAFAMEGGCASCHGQPPDDAYGKHGKHTNGSAEHKWATGANGDARSSESYGFSCGRCHNPWTPYTAPLESYKGIRHYTDFGIYKTYTVEVGFRNGTPLPANDPAKSGYSYGARGAVDTGISGADYFGFNTPNTGAGTCRNIYCHGQFYGGYSSNDPVWNSSNSQPCGKCHGVAYELGDGLPGTTGSTNWGAHPRHAGNGTQQYGVGGNFRCNACHSLTATQNAISSIGLDKINHVNGRINLKFYTSYGYSASTYDSMNNYSAAIPNTTITKKAYKTCGLIYCHSDGSRMVNFSAPFNANQGTGTGRYPNWTSLRSFTTTVAAIGGKSRCARCHGNTSFKGITAAMPGVTSKGNSHDKHIRNGFLCYDCHSQTLASTSRTINSFTKHVNKDYDIDIVTKYGGTYDKGTKVCSNVKCHGGRPTIPWGTNDTNNCRNCHFKGSAESVSDKGFRDSYAWKSMTSTVSVPRIYSTEWAKSGHGRAGASQYPSSDNYGANKSCMTCHKASGTKSHFTDITGNPFRLATAVNHSDDLCQQCHAGSAPGAGSGGADAKVLTHYTTGWSGWGTPRASWPFKPKCVDCHDPHGDNNNRYMIKAYINYSGSSTAARNFGKRTYDLTGSSQMVFSSVGGNMMNWSSYVKSSFTGICQRCHATQANMAHFRKYSTSAATGGDGYDTSHNPKNRCTGCHRHDQGFKGKDCGECHKFPPVLSGKHAMHTVSTVTKGYPSYENKSNATRYAFDCGKCHNQASGQHIERTTPSGLYTTEVVFDGTNKVPRNPSGSYAFGARSSIDTGYTGTDNYSWVSTTGTCSNLYCHGQFFGGMTGNDPKWYNNGADDPQTCGKCHRAVKNSSGSPTGGAHNKHVTTFSMPCKTCHRATTGGFNAYTVTNRAVHVDGVTNIRLYTTSSDTTVGSRIGRYARYGSSSNDFANVTTNTSAGSVPTYRYCQNIYCHSRGTSTQNPYTSKVAYPNYTAFWGYTGNQRTPAGQACALCHGNKTYNGITAAMPDQSTGNSHKKHVIGEQLKCYVCHSNVVDANGSIATPGNHVNKFKNISVILRYKSGSTGYVDGTDTCANIKCHGGRTTPAWGSGAADCRNCHFKNSVEVTSDEGFRDSYAWKSMTSTSSVPKIYSTEWQKFGHGKYSTSGSGGRYPTSGNKAANKPCTACHKASSQTIGHGTALSGNQFRLYTAPGHIDDMCKECHTSAGARWSEATTRVKGHTSGELAAGNANWQFAPKCIDCHDPHGDKNRYMVQQYVNYSGSSMASGVRTYDLNPATQMLFSTVGNQMTWSSYVRSDYSGICQRCHNVQQNMTNFRKNLFTRTHNAGNRCTSCHKHSDGFRGSGCNGCHYFPPTLSGKHALHVATSVTMAYVDWGNEATSRKNAYGCGKCHNGGTHYTGGSGNYTTEVVFDSTNSYPKNSGTYTFGARSSIDPGADGAGGYSWTSTKGTCKNLFCHGQFYGGYTGNDPQWYGTNACGKCHGTYKNSSSPTGGAHRKHVAKSSLPCKTCHRTTTGGFNAYTVTNRTVHVDGVTNIRLYTTNSDTTVGSRIGRYAKYGNSSNEFANVTTNTSVGSAPTYRYCQNIYCHSRGTNTQTPYTSKVAYPNYTAFWGYTSNQRTPAGQGCALCHGNKTYNGITAAMPKQAGQAHEIHVVTNKLTQCYICHSNVVDANNNIATAANHVNRFKNISILVRYKTAQERYSSTVPSKKTCKNIKCHGGRTTPLWTSTANCTDCHYTASGAANAEDSFTWTNFTSTNGVAKIYSTEWKKRGHGKVKSTGKYPFSNNSGAGKTCDMCHSKSVGHNQINTFRIRTTSNQTSNPDTLCLSCHGTGSELGKLGAGTFGRITGIVSHTYYNMSTIGDFNGGTPSGKAGWNFTPKCADCHDPHGDNNNAMIHSYINMTGSDSYGKPTSLATAQAYYTAVGGQIAWSSFVRSANNGICQRCHSAEVDNFDKAQFSNHQNGQPCKNCHKHKKGFAPSGCDSCHGYPPPNAPSGWRDSMTNKSSLHVPHAWNVRARPGIPTIENDQNGGSIPNNQRGYYCNRCHGGTSGDASNGQDTNHGSNTTAGMKNMTMVYGDWSKGGTAGNVSVTDDTCSNVKCHTPRAYPRAWKKPTDCDDCHGTIRLRGATERGYKLQTTNSHKIHMNYTGAPTSATAKNYRFACANCHYNWAANNNYSTHYNNFVNMTANVGAAGVVNSVGGQFYTRGRSFKAFTTGNEATLGTCTKTYCHGGFTNGTAITKPQWKKGATTVNCGSCHWAKTNKVAGWSDGSAMPERHPKHVGTANYSFECVRCHLRTVTNNTTVINTYSSHVNSRKDVYFDNNGGMDNTGGSFTTASRHCSNIYCHSKGTDKTAPFNTRTSFPNFTAKWSHTPVSYKTAVGARAKCNYCHGNKVWTGLTSAMPNYSTERIKANSHRKHVITNNIRCTTCHYGITANNTSIANKTAHANRFWNISIDPGFVAAAGKKYSTNWANPNAGGTCFRNSCHGAAGTPKWGNPVACIDCHVGSESTSKPIKTASNGPNPVNFQEYTLYGHGRRSSTTYPSSANSGAGKWSNSTKTGCYTGESPAGCHSSAAGHMSKDTTDPFRLGAYKTDVNGLCLSCHDGAGGGESALNPAHHTAAQLSSSRTWPFTPKCVDCHDPHGDSNLSMIRSAVNTPRASGFNSYTEGGGSGVFGNPTGGGTITNVTFSNRNGKAAGSYASNTAGTGLCEICHSNQISPAVNWYNRQGDSNKTGTTHETRTGACSPTCHNHQTGFKGAGESTGGTKCGDCHDLYGRMRTNTNFHHVMNNTTAAYKNKTSFNTTAYNAAERRCLMCHVDHDAFNPTVKSTNRRAANLRKNATQLTNKTGFATDFWPAKRTGTYAASSPITPTSSVGGVCISCHKGIQSKNTTLRSDSDRSIYTPKIRVDLYTSSSHNFQIRSGMNNFADGSSFRANCSKCHGTFYMNKTDGAQGREEFGLHDSQYQSLNRPMGGVTSYKAPLSKQLCYRCHGKGGFAQRNTYDYYSTIPMASSAKLIESAVEAKTYGHPAGAFPGHKGDEVMTLSLGWMGNDGANKHVDCTDCHNTHGGNASVTRNVGSPTGNAIAGAQIGVWGVRQTSWPTTPGSDVTFAKITTVTHQWQVCAKCHTKFAWNANTPPRYPSPGYNGYTGSPLMTDVMKEFNPNNYGYHPVVSVGKNQPAKAAYAGWPTAKNNVKWRDTYNNVSGYANISGLDWTFVPPFNRRSTLACTDCHQADSTGTAVGQGIYASQITAGSWSNLANLADVDTNYAVSGGTTEGRIDLGGATYTSPTKVELAITSYASSNTSLTFKIYTAAGYGVAESGTLAVPRNKAGRSAIALTNGCAQTASCVNDKMKIGITPAISGINLDKIAVEGTFAMSESLRGPHGSMMQWILASANTNLYVDWGKDGSFATAGDRVNDPTYISANYEIRTFCWNCHRADVYQVDATNDGVNNGNYSRFKHREMVAINGGHTLAAMDANKWGIPCMQCHGGSAAGAIHGSWENSWYLDSTATALGRPAGVRLLNGSGAHLKTVISTTPSSPWAVGDLVCYVVKSPASVGGCAGSGSPEGTATSTIFNYSYTAYP